MGLLHDHFVNSVLLATVRAVQTNHAPSIGEQRLGDVLTKGMQGLHMTRAPLGYEHDEWTQLAQNDASDMHSVKLRTNFRSRYISGMMPTV